MTDKTNLSIQLDRNLKREADLLLNSLGMDLTTAITIFMKQTVMQRSQ
ncbi:MAG: hypothetical protein FWG90_08290 [Oscillospiraceae bacterium]|nr:hypothetical protein [Oscillospiraceae bacterium]